MKRATTVKKPASLANKAMRKINQFTKSVGAKMDSVTEGLKALVNPPGPPAMARIRRKPTPKR